MIDWLTDIAFKINFFAFFGALSAIQYTIFKRKIQYNIRIVFQKAIAVRQANAIGLFCVGIIDAVFIQEKTKILQFKH